MGVGDNILGFYDSLTQTFSSQSLAFMNLLLLTIVVVIYAVFIWKFYIFIYTKINIYN